MNLSFFKSECVTDQICKATHTIQEFSLSCSIIISNRCFHQMTCCIKLMSFTKITPSFFRCYDCKIGVNVAIILLRFCNQVNHFICCTLQFFIRITLQ